MRRTRRFPRLGDPSARPHGDGRKRGPGKSGPTTPAIPKPRQVSRWMLTHPDHLDEDDALGLKTAVSSCEHLERLHSHIRTFATIMKQRRGARRTPSHRRQQRSDAETDPQHTAISTPVILSDHTRPGAPRRLDLDRFT
jgi:hypothetical protein